MMELPAAKKWQIYCSRRPPIGSQPLASAPQVEEYVKALGEIAEVSNTYPIEKTKTAVSVEGTLLFKLAIAHKDGIGIFLQAFASAEGDLPAEACALVDGLKTALRTRAHSFVLRFIKQGGLTTLLEALQRAPRDEAIIRHNLIAGIKALMNNSVSLISNNSTFPSLR